MMNLEKLAITLLPGDLLEAVESFGLGFVYVKDSQEFRNSQQVLNLLGEIEQLQLTAILINCRIARN